MTARLARILIYPIKSLDCVAVEQAEVLPSGSLRDDRRYAIVDADGNVLNGKRTSLVHRLRATFDLPRRFVEIRISEGLNDGDGVNNADRGTFHLDEDRPALEAFLTRALEQPARIVENAATGLPDDLESPGPTVISTATLRTVAGWFAGLDDTEVRRRFRANLEIDGDGAGAGDGSDLPPFWEDRLYGPAGQAVRFRIGDVELAGTNPCARCIVPTRDSLTGETWLAFAKTFAQHRQATLPDWADRSRYDHFYRLAVNTRLASQPGVIRVGDAVEVLERPV